MVEPDLTRRLSHLAEHPVAASGLPAEEVRRRGDRLRRQRQAMAAVGAAAAVAVIATTGAFAGGAFDRAGSPQPAPPAPTSPAPDPSPDALGRIPAGFPLTAGWTESGEPAQGEAGIDGPGPEDYPGIEGPATEFVPVDLYVCGDVIETEGTPVDGLFASWIAPQGERRRELRLFPDATAAQDHLATVRAAYAACPRRETDPGDVTLTEVTTVDRGDDAFGVVESYEMPDQEVSTVTLLQVVRVGNAVLVNTGVESGPDGATEDEYLAWVEPVIEAMGVFRSSGDSPDRPDPEQDPEPAGDVISPDFPLGVGHMDFRGDGGELLGPGPDVRGLEAQAVCASELWKVSATDRLAFVSTGPEYGDIRELRTFGSVDDALAQMEALRSSFAGCDREVRDGSTIVWTTYEQDTGYDSITFGFTDEAGLGGAVFQVTRVGHSVLAIMRGGEWSLDSAGAGADELTALTRQVAPAMCAFTEAGC